jgi:hypothetical protein
MDGVLVNGDGEICSLSVSDDGNVKTDATNGSGNHLGGVGIDPKGMEQW